MRSRPRNFRLNRSSPLYRSAQFLGIGGGAGTLLMRDHSGYGRNGTLTGYSGAGDTPPERWTWDTTLNRWVLGFDGSNDYISLGSSADFAPQSFTVSFWMKWAAAPATYDSPWGKTNGGTWSNGWGFWIYGTSGTQIRLNSFVYEGYGAAGAYAFFDPYSSWHHVALTHDGTTTLVYSDGVAGTPRVAARSPTGTTNPCEIGRLGTDAYNVLGQLADPMLLCCALSPDAIRAIADPSNTLIRVGGVPLILPVRRWWPVGGAETAYYPWWLYKQRVV